MVDSGKGAGGAGGTGAGPFSEQRLVAKLSEYSEYPFFSMVTFLHARKFRSLDVSVRFIFKQPYLLKDFSIYVQQF